MVCKYCGNMIDDYAGECPHCHSELRVCKFCGEEVDVHALECPHCHGKLWGKKRGYGRKITGDEWALFAFIFSFILPGWGLIFSIIACVRCKKEGSRRIKLAIAGIVIGAVMVAVINVLLYIFYVLPILKI